MTYVWVVMKIESYQSYVHSAFDSEKGAQKFVASKGDDEVNFFIEKLEVQK
jgi:hypothetical protein